MSNDILVFSLDDNNFEIEWVNPIIEVNVYEDIGNYIENCYPIVKINNEEYNDIFVKRNRVEYTYQSTINTSKIGNYSIKYELTINGYKLDRKIIKEVIFIVSDKEPPYLVNNPLIEIEIGDKIDYKKYFIFKDNYNKENEIGFHFDDSSIDYYEIGNYDLIIYLEDESKNKNTYTHNVLIKDTIAPIIKRKSNLIIEYNEEINIYDYFTIEDNHKIDKLEFNDINTTINEVQALTINACDVSNNCTTKTFNVEIKDTKAPIINFKNDYLIINHNNDLLLELKNNIDNIIDNNKYINDENLIIDYSNFKEEEGFYNIIYRIKDDFNNESTYILPVVYENSNNISNSNNKNKLLNIYIIILIILIIMYVIFIKVFKNKVKDD